MAGETVLVIDDSPTILKVVQLVLTKAGFEVDIAGDGETALAMARERRPDVILLDFVMPKLNGYQVCRALQADEALAHVPVILMSAKGDQVGERFVKVMGIVDYITKPFSPEAITAVVSHTVSKYRRVVPSVDAVEDPTDGVVERDLLRRKALGEVRDAIAQAVAQRIANLVALAHAAAEEGSADGRVPTDAAAIAEAARQALTDDALSGILGSLRPLGGDEAVLEGDLGVVPIAEILGLLATQAQSGVLTVARARGAVDVCFQKGKIDLAMGRELGEEFLLGSVVVSLGMIQKADLDAFLTSRAGNRLIGHQLVKLGVLSEGDLREVLSKQTHELTYEILRWNFGRFSFLATKELPAPAVDAALGLYVDGILMEGFRRVDEWHLIERELMSFDEVFVRNEDAVAQMGRGRLTREEHAVLDLVNGKHSVKDIVRQSRMGSFDVSKMLYRLLSIKLIRRRVMPVAV